MLEPAIKSENPIESVSDLNLILSIMQWFKITAIQSQFSFAFIHFTMIQRFTAAHTKLSMVDCMIETALSSVIVFFCLTNECARFGAFTRPVHVTFKRFSFLKCSFFLPLQSGTKYFVVWFMIIFKRWMYTISNLKSTLCSLWSSPYRWKPLLEKKWNRCLFPFFI